MLGRAQGVRVFYYRLPCDMRRQMDGLSAMVRTELGQDPEAGDLFVFKSRRGDICKVLFYDGLGCCLLAKRLHQGTFRIGLDPSSDQLSVEITQDELASLLSRAEILQREGESLNRRHDIC